MSTVQLGQHISLLSLNNRQFWAQEILTARIRQCAKDVYCAAQRDIKAEQIACEFTQDADDKFTADAMVA